MNAKNLNFKLHLENIISTLGLIVTSILYVVTEWEDLTTTEPCSSEGRQIFNIRIPSHSEIYIF